MKFTTISDLYYGTGVFILLIWALGCSDQKAPPPPEAYGIVPSDNQIEWHQTEFYAFIHFTINTFTDKEWGFGDESPELFNPSGFDAEQIVLTCKNAGMKGIVLTAKHHDGFCLWPTKTTDHNISKSPFKDGKGDLVREIVDACRKHGLKVGMYLSPWDRNNAAYGTPEYIDIFRAQLTELLTNYGEIFEVWFDGANGGTGYYGGANEKREIDRQTYYDWENTWALVRELQPNAVIFSDVGPDVRWVGTEKGFSGDPCWHRFTPEPLEEGQTPAPGLIKYWESLNGTREGKHWMPAETNTSIRPGWFYHEAENDKVKTPEQLVDIHYNSIGHGTNFILNLPPDKVGVIPDEDVASLTGFRAILDKTFSVNLAEGAIAKASNVRGDGATYAADKVLDNNNLTYWATDDDTHTANITLEFPEEVSFNVVNIQEYIPLGQRIWGWALDKWENNQWTEFAKAESIGNRRLWRGSIQTTNKLRLRITDAPASPLISTLSVHKEPIRLSPPKIIRNNEGKVDILSNGTIHYTLDGNEPTKESPQFQSAFDFRAGGTIKAKTFDGEKASETATTHLGHSKNKWSILTNKEIPENASAKQAIDEKANTNWTSNGADERTITIDFGEVLSIDSFSMLPPGADNKEGMVLAYEFYGSNDNKDWHLISQGEFSNIYNNPVEQTVQFDSINKVRYIKFIAVETVRNKEAVISELGVGIAK
nr:alpha-L-fucosidase [uncultured Allomuricauda sp.]